MKVSVLGVIFELAAVVALLTTAHAQTVQAELERQVTELKSKTASLIASESTPLHALSADQRLAAPPAVWKVPGAIEQFRECADCPEMVVVPAGEFTMGSPNLEMHRGAEAQHRVTITAPFAVSKFEITFDEWDACVADGGCGAYSPDDENWGRGRRPVTNVSWQDAQAYAAWLSRKTGKAYRLLSEAEWEYAARAGTITAFSIGESLAPNQANYDASTDGAGASDVNRQRTMPVGSFLPNPFGLYDMHGNVSEWVEDCWHDEYMGAPTDGSVWREKNCKGRVVRGGSWEDYDGDLRSAARTGGAADEPLYTDGIRIARSL